MNNQDIKITDENISLWRKAYDVYSSLFLKIIDKDANILPLVFNRMQCKLWQLFLYQIKQGIPIRWLIVKNRQQGCSTWVLGLFFWITTLFPNRNTLVINHDGESATNLFNKAKLFYKLLPDNMRPLKKNSNRKELYFANPNEEGELGLESRILIDTAGSEAQGVSYTFQWVLFSEVAVAESKGIDIKEIFSGLKQSVPKRAGTGIILETTPRGEGYVSDFWNDDTNSYTKIFISSAADETYRIELKPDEYFLLSDDKESKYGDEETEFEYFEDEVKKWYPEFNLKTSEGKQQLHHEVMCRLAWRRGMIDDECEGDKLIFDREYPITIEKAFATSGSALFNIELLKQMKKYLENNPPSFNRYSFQCNSRIDSSLNDFYLDNIGMTRIFEEVMAGCQYVIGGDVAEGIEGGDKLTLSCRRLPELQHVFYFEGIVDPHTYALIAHKLHLIYNEAFMGIETNEKGGYAAVQYLLDVLKCRRLYKRQVMLKPKEFGEKYGWHTGDTTKPTMMADFRRELNNHTLPILCVKEIEQLIKFKKMSNGHTGVVGELGDDIAMADMICLQMAKFVHLAPEKETKPRVKFTGAWWTKQLQNVSGDYIGSNPKGPDYL